MPTCTVRYLGPIRRPCPQREHEVEIDEDMTATELLERLGYAERDRPRISIHLNGRAAKADATLRGGDEITLGVLAGGG